MSFTDRIKPTDKGITTYLDDLKNDKYQIPTFQRNVVWEKENVKNFGTVYTNFILLVASWFGRRI